MDQDAVKQTSFLHAEIKKIGKGNSKYCIDETKYEPGNSLSECMISPQITSHLMGNILFHILLCFVYVRYPSSMRISSVRQFSCKFNK